MKKKPFIVFIDGADGVGKTTTLEGLHTSLTNKYPDLKIGTFNIMRSTNAGDEIRSVVINEEIDETLRFCGYMFGVFYGLYKLYKESDADIVICDRSHASTFAQNIYAPVDTQYNRDKREGIFSSLLQTFVMENRNQFIHVFLHVDQEVAQERLKQTREEMDLLEKRGTLYQEAIENGHRIYFKNIDTGALAIPTFNTGEVKTEDIVKAVIKTLEHANVIRVPQ